MSAAPRPALLLSLVAAACSAPQAWSQENPGEPAPDASILPGGTLPGELLPGRDADPDQPAGRRPAREWLTRVATRSRGDVDELLVRGGLRYVDQELGLDVRADSAVLVVDRPEAVRRFQDESSGLPRRTPGLPASRRTVTPEVLRERLISFLGSLRGPETAPPPASGGFDLELFRSLHLEGDVTILRDGAEVLRASALTLSLIDDRLVLDDVVLRVVDGLGVGNRITLRTARLVREGKRFVGRDVAVSTSRAGVPQFELVVGEIEIIERGAEFEIRSRDNTLAVGGRRLLPVPDQTWFSSERPDYLLRGVAAGSSAQQGLEFGLRFGSSWNGFGGWLHEQITGEAREKFRGDWELGTQWIEKRGVLLRPRLDYSGDGLYTGYAAGLFLEDAGDDIGRIQTGLDGERIDVDTRTLIRTENQIQIDENTRLDVTLFQASDAAAMSEFLPRDLIELERPETSIHLRHAQDNQIATLTGRWNANSFQYGDDRGLTPSFLQEEPRLTYDLFAASLAELPFDTELLLSASTDIGRFRNVWDPDAPLPGDETATWRVDQSVELSVPFRVGPVAVRPWSSGRVVWYDRALDGNSEARSAFSAGIETGTRLARGWGWTDDEGARQGLTHVLSPTVGLRHTFAVDGNPDDFPSFDSTDRLTEQATLRVGLLQRLLRSTKRIEDEETTRAELLWLDVAQNFLPIADRDNGGETLGVLEFEAAIRPLPRQLTDAPVQILVEGEHDWQESELRTFNTFLTVPTGDVTWLGEYRTDRTQNGQIGFGARMDYRTRWRLFGRSLYDLETSQFSRFNAELARNDLDWTISVGVNYDAITDNLGFQINFTPTLGGLVERPTLQTIGNAGFGADQHAAY